MNSASQGSAMFHKDLFWTKKEILLPDKGKSMQITQGVKTSV